MSKKNKESQQNSMNLWKEIIVGNFLVGEMMRRNKWYILFLVVLALFYISNRYNCQQAMIEEKQLTDTLEDRRYKAMTAHSELLKMTLRSHVEENLEDSTIRTPVVPPYSLPNE